MRGLRKMSEEYTILGDEKMTNKKETKDEDRRGRNGKP